VFAGSSRHGEQIAWRIEAGAVNVNDVLTTYTALGVPMGGWKESGIGFRHASYGIKKFVRPESIVSPRVKQGKSDPLWFPYTRRKRKMIHRVPASSTRAGCVTASASGRGNTDRAPDARHLARADDPGGRARRRRVRRVGAAARTGARVAADRQVRRPGLRHPAARRGRNALRGRARRPRPGRGSKRRSGPQALPGHRSPGLHHRRGGTPVFGLRARLRAQRPPLRRLCGPRRPRARGRVSPPARGGLGGSRQRPRHPHNPPPQLRPLVRAARLRSGRPPLHRGR
jgi:hypothetical protein